ncbi:MAG: aminotransferase class I/II-fold pyridoxal phosphate-dependent enzyme [Bacteroidota bacterium]
MREKIKQLEIIARGLDPDPALRADWNRLVQDYADGFLSSVAETPAYVETEDKGSGLLDWPVPEEGRDLSELLAVLRENVDGPGLNPASGGHLAYIPGGGVYATALGDYLAAVTNRYSGIFFASPGAVRMENQLIRWMCRLVGYPDTALGNLASGGSIANLTAIATARDARKVRAADIPNSPIYLTAQVHHSIQKALRIAGLGEAPLRYVRVDERFRMDLDDLRRQVAADRAAGLRPFLLVASGGTTDTGAIDPLDELADLAQREDLWFHVDAAYGGFFLLAPEVRADFKGIERADSITIDPHKGLFLAYGTGALLIRDVAALRDTHYYLANYMQDTIGADAELSPADLSPELTKHFRGLRMWLALQLYGVNTFRATLSQKLWLCRYFYQRVQQLGFEVGPPPELSVMIYRYRPPQGDVDAFNRRLVDEVRRDGRVFLSSTSIDGVFWIRLAVLSFRTDLSWIDRCLGVLEEKVVLLLTNEQSRMPS